MRKDAMKEGDELALYYGTRTFTIEPDNWHSRNTIANVVKVKIIDKMKPIEVPAGRFSQRKVPIKGIEVELLEDIETGGIAHTPPSWRGKKTGDRVVLRDASNLVMFWDEFEKAAGAVREKIHKERQAEERMNRAAKEFREQIAVKLNVGSDAIDFDPDDEYVQIEISQLAEALGMSDKLKQLTWGDDDE